MEVSDAQLCTVGSREFMIAGAAGEQQVIDLKTMKVYSLTDIIAAFLNEVTE